MPRRSEPWKRGGRGPWLTKLGGRLVPLAPESATKGEAARILRALLVERDRGRTIRPVVHVVDLATAFLADCRGRVDRGEMAPETLTHYAANLRFFVPDLGGMDASEIRPHHVGGFLAAHPTWNATTRAGVITTIKRVFRWAKRTGLIDLNPLADLEKPRARRREAIPTPEGARAALDGCTTEPFRDFLWVLHETGCRPGEARRIEAKDLDLDHGHWRRPGKTTRRTGVLRTVHLTPALTERLRVLAGRWPDGPVLRNTRGNPWTQSGINCAMRRLRARIGAGGELTPYGMRHLFVTDALASNVPIATVAELVGHRSTAMISRYYSHLSERAEHLKEALRKVRGQETSDLKTSAR